MIASEISNIRIRSQQIEGSKYRTVKELVAWMGAMQAQDFAMAKWAIGLRIPDSTEQLIEKAYNQGEIIRTHLMRPTWHIVSAEDVYWMLELTSPQIRPLLKARDKQLELDKSVYSKSRQMLESALANGISMTREELANEYENISVQTNENRLSHLMMTAELDGTVCSGPMRGNKLTYSLLADRVTTKKVFTREEALAKLAQRYFQSHCPATLRDFTWWSGLSITEARKALEMIKPFLVSEIIDSTTYWITNTFTESDSTKTSVHLLPAFDEFLIGYTNRNAALALVNNKKTISDNGIFRPIIVVNGQVNGLWKRLIKKDRVLIETDHFQLHDKETITGIEKELMRYGKFLNKRVEIINRRD